MNKLIMIKIRNNYYCTKKKKKNKNKKKKKWKIIKISTSFPAELG